MPEFLINLGTVFLGSGAALALFNWYVEHRREKRTRADETEFLALQLAIKFEDFAVKCAAKVSDHKLAQASDGNSGKQIGDLPEAPQLPTSDAYKFFDRKLLDDIFQFPQNHLMADREANFLWDVELDPETCAESYKDNAVRLGVKASKLANEIRRSNQLPIRKLTYQQWDIDSFLSEEKSRIHERAAR